MTNEIRDTHGGLIGFLEMPVPDDVSRLELPVVLGDASPYHVPREPVKQVTVRVALQRDPDAGVWRVSLDDARRVLLSPHVREPRK